MMRSRSVLAAVLLLISIVACAYNSVPEWSRSPRFTGCTSEELRTVSASFARAARIVDAALEAIKAPENERRAEAGEWNAYRWWFGEFAPGRFASVRSVIAATRAEFEHTVSIRCGEKTVNCPESFPAETAQGAVSDGQRTNEDRDRYGPEPEINRRPRREWQEFAYANHLVPVVQLCQDFFSQTRSEQAAILVHELTHVSSDTADHAYGDPALLELANTQPGQAIRNAASYAAFVESVGAGRRPGERVLPSDERD